MSKCSTTSDRCAFTSWLVVIGRSRPFIFSLSSPQRQRTRLQRWREVPWNEYTVNRDIEQQRATWPTRVRHVTGCAAAVAALSVSELLSVPVGRRPRSSLLPGPSTGNPSPLFCTLMQSSYTTRRQKESPPQWLHWHVDSDDSVSINQLGRLHSQRDPYVGSRTRLSEVAVGPSGVTTPSLDFDPSAKTSVVQTSGTSAFIFK